MIETVSSPDAVAPNHPATPTPTSTITLDSLPPDDLARIMTFLDIEDVQNLMTCSKTLHLNCRDERAWHSMCTTSWGAVTDPRLWLHYSEKDVVRAKHIPTPTAANKVHHTVAAPTSFRHLYFYLRHVQHIVGFWRLIYRISSIQSHHIIRFCWTEDGIVGEELLYTHFDCREPDRIPFARLCPRKGLDVELEWYGNEKHNKNVTLKYVPRGSGGGGEGGGGLGGRPIHRTPSAEAAAAVSYGGTPQSASILGTSPEGSFEHAWMEFIASSVARPSKVRRRSSRGGAARGPVLHHLRSMMIPIPTPRHPLAGVWLMSECDVIGGGGDGGGGGDDELDPGRPNFITIKYDFSQKQAQIIGHSGQSGNILCLKAYAAPIITTAQLNMPTRQEWPQEERELYTLCEQVVQAHVQVQDVFQGLFLDDASDSDGGEREGEERTDDTATTEVLAIHIGSYRSPVDVDGDENAIWDDTRIWVCANGELKMFVLPPSPLLHLFPEQHTNAIGYGLLRRIDKELQCCSSAS